MHVCLTDFVLRQFRADHKGTRIPDFTPAAFLTHVNRAFDASLLRAGYAPFCRHLFLRNFTDVAAGVAEITDENRHLLHSGYEARRESELPVLRRWFEGLPSPPAEWLDIILYSQEQLRAEGDACEAPWGIVAIHGELLPEETPIDPATQLRNALGIPFGGSGAPIDEATYRKAVAYWDCHAVVR